MSIARKVASLFLSCSIVACSLPVESARTASADESKAILAPLIEDLSPMACIKSEFEPPLERERRNYAWERKRRADDGWQLRIRKSIEKLLFGPPEQTRTSDWYQWRGQETLSLRSEDVARLEESLRKAVADDLPSRGISLAGIVAPHLVGKGCKAPRGEAKVFFTQPVIIGNLAFLEESAVCGELCGSGRVVAFIRRSGKWNQLAEHGTWIS